MVALREAGKKSGNRGFRHADRILGRKHFKLLYQRNPEDIKMNPNAVRDIYVKAADTFGKTNIRMDSYESFASSPDFPVQLSDERVTSSLFLSKTLNHIPTAFIDYVCVHPGIYEDTVKWLKENRNNIINS
ncbi:MAG: hypothetical protein GY940_38840 [bacterium]|nr:hypothetical protein [bacterium]